MPTLPPSAKPGGSLGRRVVLPYDERVAWKWGQLSVLAEQRGRARPINHTWIAACCLVAHPSPKTGWWNPGFTPIERGEPRVSLPSTRSLTAERAIRGTFLPMNMAKRALHAADALQQQHAWLAVPVAVWKKFGDDQAGNLAALIAYYAFVAIFPLLLVLVTVLDIVLKNDPNLREKLLDSALKQYPVIGPQLGSNIGPLHKSGLILVIGLLGTFIGARGVATAMQNALNSAWEIPYARGLDSRGRGCAASG